ncbi:hypothetical protein K443DRAFT_8653 [Laccaria amethystina LaAM-08-1]|uniref:Uncharacterized protein n=1 Tax=Laccaria amethystina LaAM-08-1 TaxID=1095629 RepID=A0A0C9WNI8_9AGAR|nr:hypothetical protein K443DRAFT_8653 [Laccaria amethystina LaAM-08-1]
MSLAVIVTDLHNTWQDPFRIDIPPVHTITHQKLSTATPHATMSSTLTFLPPSSSPKFKDTTILDAGSSATCIYVNSWDTSQGDDNLKVTKVYPDEEAMEQAKGGLVVLERTPGWFSLLV